MKNKDNAKIIRQNRKGLSMTYLYLGIIILVILIAIVINYLDNNNKENIMKNNISNSFPVIKSIASWKTYSSGEVLRKMGISYTIKYPANWDAYKKNPNRPSALPWVTFRKQPVQDFQTSACVSVGGGIMPDTETIDDFIKQKENASSNINSKVLSKYKITMNNLTGIKLRVIKYNNSQPSWQVYFKDGVNFYLIESCPDTPDNVFNQIISTFQLSK
jgi:hypothetical protein